VSTQGNEIARDIHYALSTYFREDVWRVHSVYELADGVFGHITVRIEMRNTITGEVLTIQHVASVYLPDTRVTRDSMVAEVIMCVRNELAQWDRRQREELAERRRQQETERIMAQTRAAASATATVNIPEPPAPPLQQIRGFATPGRDYYIQPRVDDLYFRQIFDNPPTTLRGNAQETMTYRPVLEPVAESINPPPSRADIEELVARFIEEKLDIRISMDESDGEVSVEVEVLFNGKVIGSDSDSIRI
jgi:hypothetical protein